MATRSTIAVKLPNGNILAVYCHWDGYPSHNGAILQDCYNTYETAIKLIKGGNMSSLGKSIESTDYYNNPSDSPVELHTDKEYREFFQEYNYLFADGKWSWVKDTDC